MIPKEYKWLKSEPGPKMLLAALALYGIAEVPGKRNNPIILDWAKRLGVENIYTADEIAWCGLFMGIVAISAGKDVPNGILWALNWAKFGDPADTAMLGDVLVFTRAGGGGHVGLYVGEDDQAYHVLGGNTGDKVSIARLLKIRCKAIRRPKYTTQPANVRKIFLSANGILSTNER